MSGKVGYAEKVSGIFKTPGGAKIEAIADGERSEIRAELPNGRVLRFDKDLIEEAFHLGYALQQAAKKLGYEVTRAAGSSS